MANAAFIAIAALVLGYRVLVVVALEPFSWLDLLLNGMGLVYLAASLYVYLAPRHVAHAGLAAGYLLMGALHWGGYVVFGDDPVASVVVYLTFSGVVAQTLLLDFALNLTRGPFGLAPRSGIYVLPGLCVVIGAWAIVARSMVDYFVLAHAVQTNLFALAAVIFLLVGWGRPHARILGLAVLMGALPYVLAVVADALFGPIDVLGRGVEPMNLFFVLIPVGFVLAPRIR